MTILVNMVTYENKLIKNKQNHNIELVQFKSLQQKTTNNYVKPALLEENKDDNTYNQSFNIIFSDVLY